MGAVLRWLGVSHGCQTHQPGDVLCVGRDEARDVLTWADRRSPYPGCSAPVAETQLSLWHDSLSFARFSFFTLPLFVLLSSVIISFSANEIKCWTCILTQRAVEWGAFEELVAPSVCMGKECQGPPAVSKASSKLFGYQLALSLRLIREGCWPHLITDVKRKEIGSWNCDWAKSVLMRLWSAVSS